MMSWRRGMERCQSSTHSYKASRARRARVMSAGAAITAVYRLYGEWSFPSPALRGHSPNRRRISRLRERDHDADYETRVPICEATTK